MKHDVVAPPPLQPGNKVAILSPAWPAPAYYPEIHAQAMERVRTVLGLEPIEFPTTATMGCTPKQRADDVNAAFADPEIRAILSTVGGDDQIMVTPHLDPALPQADPKPFFGYSDNTNISNWLWRHGVGSYYGGATQVHLGPAQVDDLHIQTLEAALFGGGDVELAMPETSEDYGVDWSSPDALTMPAERFPSPPVEFIGSDDAVRGRTWGGCLEVVDQLAMAGRLPDAGELEGAILIFETSELIPAADYVGRWVRAMGERGYLEAAAGFAFAQPVVSDRDKPVPSEYLQARRDDYTQYLLSNISRYRNDLLVCLNIPFGHTRPQAILPYGGEITLNPARETVTAHYPTR